MSLTEFRKAKLMRDRQRLWNIGVIVFCLVGIALVVLWADWRLCQKTAEDVRLDKISTNLKSCPNRLVYGKDNPFVYYHGKKVFLEKRGC